MTPGSSSYGSCRRYYDDRFGRTLAEPACFVCRWVSTLVAVGTVADARCDAGCLAESIPKFEQPLRFVNFTTTLANNVEGELRNYHRPSMIDAGIELLPKFTDFCYHDYQLSLRWLAKTRIPNIIDTGWASHSLLRKLR